MLRKIVRWWRGDDARDAFDAAMEKWDRRIDRRKQQFRPDLVTGWADETPQRRVIYADAGSPKSRGTTP